jgi:hypothetical protein
MHRILVPALVLSASMIYLAGAAEAERPWRQVLILRPVHTMGPWMEFDYNSRNALPPFEKEPALAGKEFARGLIPTIPPTPLIRNITDRELYLKVDHGRDFTLGPLVTHKSQCRDGVHVTFDDLQVFTKQGSLAIPYTVHVSTYRSGYAGRLSVRSGWSGRLERGGGSWKFTVIDNLDGQIDGQDLLVLSSGAPTGARFFHDCPVPQVLFLDGHTCRLDFAFKSVESEVVLEVALTEIQLPTGELRIEAHGCQSLALRDDRQILLLSGPGGTASVPIGNYRVENCILTSERSQGRDLQFAGSDRAVSVQPGQTTSLRVGLPLSNTIVAVRDRNLLRLTYQLVGAGGETYHYGGPMRLPSFRIYQGPLRISEGSFGFG